MTLSLKSQALKTVTDKGFEQLYQTFYELGTYDNLIVVLSLT